MAITLFALAWSSPRLSRTSLVLLREVGQDGGRTRMQARGVRDDYGVEGRGATGGHGDAVALADAERGLGDVVDPAVTRPARGVNDVRRPELAITI